MQCSILIGGLVFGLGGGRYFFGVVYLLILYAYFIWFYGVCAVMCGDISLGRFVVFGLQMCNMKGGGVCLGRVCKRLL